MEQSKKNLREIIAVGTLLLASDGPKKGFVDKDDLELFIVNFDLTSLDEPKLIPDPNAFVESLNSKRLVALLCLIIPTWDLPFFGLPFLTLIDKRSKNHTGLYEKAPFGGAVLFTPLGPGVKLFY